MKKYYRLLFFVILIFWSCGEIQGDDPLSNVSVREPAVAGKFYSDSPEQLKKTCDYFFNNAVDTNLNRPLAMVAPHAGYIYSGQIAADAYNQTKNFKYDVIIVLGTNHTTAGFNKISIYPHSGYKTPFGTVQIDKELANAILQSDKDFTFNPKVHEREHSVEVQIPLIQFLFPGIKIVPLIIGSANAELCQKLGNVLAELLKNRQPLIVASSDLSHYPSVEDAAIVDNQVLKAITQMKAETIRKTIQEQMDLHIPNLRTCACGEDPIITAVTAAKKMGANKGTIISYSNSGKSLIGDPERAVGYGAVVFSSEKAANINKKGKPKSFEQFSPRLSSSDKQKILSFARLCIEQYLFTETLPLVRNLPPACNRLQGAFVTLKKNGQLRGCIGHMAENLPLGEVIGRMALQAAFNDRRFNPLQIDEWPFIELEISILTPNRLIKSVNDIRIGLDGVVLEKNNHHAVFLPQVAAEQNWNKTEFLENLCRKAGLPSDSWKQGAKMYVFQADVFDEADF